VEKERRWTGTDGRMCWRRSRLEEGCSAIDDDDYYYDNFRHYELLVVFLFSQIILSPSPP
jgi:hypothetical protein